FQIFGRSEAGLALQRGRPSDLVQRAVVSSNNPSKFLAVSMLMMNFCNFLHRSLPITSPPSAVNLTAISSSVIGSRGSPFGTSTRVECDLPSLVVMVTRLG